MGHFPHLELFLNLTSVQNSVSVLHLVSHRSSSSCIGALSIDISPWKLALSVLDSDSRTLEKCQP